MKRRTTWVLVGLVLVASAAVATFLVRDGPPTVELDEQAQAGDEVTIYQAGLASVQLDRTVNTTQDRVLIELAVPASTVTDSLRLRGEGVTVREVRAQPSLDGPIQPGDDVVVHTETDVYRGVLVDQRGDGLVLAQSGNTTVVQGDHVVAVEVPGRDLAGQDADARRVGVLADLDRSADEVTVGYLAHGPSWSPSYQLDLDSGDARFDATLSGVHTWRNVTLHLVAGQPNVAESPSPGGGFERGVSDDAAGGGTEISASQPVGELHRFTVERPVNLTQGQTLRLPVREGQLAIQDRFLSVQASTGFGDVSGDGHEVPVQDRYTVENTFEEPLPGGVMRLYEGSTWIGEDRIPTVPAGETTNVTAGRSTDVQADLALVSLNATRDQETRAYRLTVENHKASGESVDAVAQLSYPSFRTNLVSTSPDPVRVEGTEVTWRATIDAGEEAGFRLTYEQLQR